ncbi:MAG: hypothetical protein LC785_04020 [Acidobacteria bacterium]|nr:hypothetical protein [Acidobacteriota bacterium]MCA1641151.1 hypothetical protein [Acidobacteriota bacterium]
MNNLQRNDEHEKLLENLRRAEQITAESQAEAAVYRDLLEECWRAASEALKNEDLNLLYKITGKFSFDWMPSEHEGKQWGKLFLHAYMRDAGWLKLTKERLEQIKAYAEMILEDNETNAELKKKIIAAAEDGLITHI